jgi:large subunit ribosomal protein L9
MPRIRRTIPILLLDDSEKLGHVGDIVKVRPGFARNYLFPIGAACPVTDDALRRVERAKSRAVEQRRKRAADLAAVAEKLEGLSLTIEEKASEEGHLFGSVGASAIAAALAEHGVDVHERQIELAAPLKELGIFSVKVQLDKDQAADVRIWVVEPGE